MPAAENRVAGSRRERERKGAGHLVCEVGDRLDIVVDTGAAGGELEALLPDIAGVQECACLDHIEAYGQILGGWIAGGKLEGGRSALCQIPRAHAGKADGGRGVIVNHRKADRTRAAGAGVQIDARGAVQGRQINGDGF